MSYHTNMNQPTPYIVNVYPDGKYWSIDVPQVERTTQARTRKEIPVMAQDLISIMTGEPNPIMEIHMTDEE